MRRELLQNFTLGLALSFFRAQEDHEAAKHIENLIALKDQREDIDDHMQEVADYLLGGDKPDYQAIKARVNAEVDELLARDSGGDDAPGPGEPE